MGRIRVGLGLETGIADLNQIAELKLSILVPIQIADLNLTPSLWFENHFYYVRTVHCHRG